MTEEFYTKKQVIFPGLVVRIVTGMLDFMIVSIIASPILKIMILSLFKFHFADFIEANSLIVSAPEDIQIVITHDKFREYLTANSYSIYFIEMIFVQFFLFGIYFIFSWWKFGTTFIKYIFKMKVIDYKTQNKPSFKACVIRYISYLFLFISAFFIVFRKDKRAIHDILSGTIVIKS